MSLSFYLLSLVLVVLLMTIDEWIKQVTVGRKAFCSLHSFVGKCVAFHSGVVLVAAITLDLFSRWMSMK